MSTSVALITSSVALVSIIIVTLIGFQKMNSLQSYFDTNISSLTNEINDSRYYEYKFDKKSEQQLKELNTKAQQLYKDLVPLSETDRVLAPLSVNVGGNLKVSDNYLETNNIKLTNIANTTQPFIANTSNEFIISGKKVIINDNLLSQKNLIIASALKTNTLQTQQLNANNFKLADNLSAGSLDANAIKSQQGINIQSTSITPSYITTNKVALNIKPDHEWFGKKQFIANHSNYPSWQMQINNSVFLNHPAGHGLYSTTDQLNVNNNFTVNNNKVSSQGKYLQTFDNYTYQLNETPQRGIRVTVPNQDPTKTAFQVKNNNKEVLAVYNNNVVRFQDSMFSPNSTSLQSDTINLSATNFTSPVTVNSSLKTQNANTQTLKVTNTANLNSLSKINSLQTNKLCINQTCIEEKDLQRFLK